MSSVLNWSFFIVYSIGMVILGYVGMRRSKTAEDYSVAGRNFPNRISIPLFAASFLSAASIIGFSGAAFDSGFSFLLLYPLGFAVGWLALQLMAMKFRRGPSWNTTPDIFAERYYSKFMRSWMALFYIAYMFLYVVIGLMGVGLIVSVFLGVDSRLAFLIVGVVFLAYTSMGGMYAVGWTNVVQFALLASGIALAAGFGLYKAGGLGNLFAELGAISGDGIAQGDLLDITRGGDYSANFLIGSAAALAGTVIVTTYYHRMFFSAKDDRRAGSFIGFSAPILLTLYVGIGVIGWTARVLLPSGTGQEEAFPSLIAMMPAVMAALVLTAVAAAVMSSIDTQLLSAGVMMSHDIYHKRLNPRATQRQIARVSRWSTLALGIAAIVLAMAEVALIIEIYNFFITIAATTLFVPLMLGLYWKRTTKEAGIVGTIVGCVGGVFWHVFGPASIHAVTVMVPLVLVLMVVVSVRTAPPPADVVARFHSREDIPDTVEAH